MMTGDPFTHSDPVNKWTVRHGKNNNLCVHILKERTTFAENNNLQNSVRKFSVVDLLNALYFGSRS